MLELYQTPALTRIFSKSWLHGRFLA